MTTPKPQEPTKPQQPTPLPEAAEEEFGGQKGPEPTRFGDWEKSGRCTDF